MKLFKSQLLLNEEFINEGVNDPSTFKAVFLAGGPGSGKDFVMNKLLTGYGLVEINSDNALEALMDKHGLDKKRMPKEQESERNEVRGRARNITAEKNRLAI